MRISSLPPGGTPNLEASADAAESIHRKATPRRALSAVSIMALAAAGLTGLSAPAFADDAPAEYTGVQFDWTMSGQVQGNMPFGGGNFLSAGESDGKQPTYNATEGNVDIVHVVAGEEVEATWENRNAHTSGGVDEQFVRLNEGNATVNNDGSAAVQWDGTFSVNFYGGLVPFWLTDPELVVNSDGTGQLVADIGGYGSDMDNPFDMFPMDPVTDVTVATFDGVTIDTDGSIDVQPHYEGVTIDVPSEHSPQVTTGSSWGSWPQEFVDFHFDTNLSSYWYSSGGAADALKAPTPFTVDFSTAELVSEVPTEPEPTEPEPTEPEPTEPEPTEPEPADGSTNYTDVEFDWSVSGQVQGPMPFGGSNFLSAGESDGEQGTYSVADGNVEIFHVTDGQEVVPTWAERHDHVSGDVDEQFVRLNEGNATVNEDGSAAVQWDGTFSVNFYGGLVPFWLEDLRFEVEEDGTGELLATIGGYGSDMDNPFDMFPMDPVSDITVATFDDVSIDTEGSIEVAPHYEGVVIDVPEEHAPQDASADGWGSWPQEFVDFHFATNLSSYWYSSGSAADSMKAPTPFIVDFTNSQIGGPGAGDLTEPNDDPTDTPTDDPTDTPTDGPSDVPTDQPTDTPTGDPSDAPTDTPINDDVDAGVVSGSNDGGSKGGLASTGAQAGLFAAAGLLLLLTGGAATAFSRKRKIASSIDS